MNKDLLLDRIREVYPTIEIDKAERNRFGQNNDVIIINDCFVFRFPKYIEGINNLKNEVILLNSISKAITTPIPVPVFLSLNEQQAGKAFAGYKILSGNPMWKNELRAVNQNGLGTVAYQLVSFLKQMHTFPLDTLHSDIKEEFKEPGAEIESLYIKLIDKVYPYMSSESKGSVSHRFETFIENEKTKSTIPTLIHGDFGASNILWDAATNKVTGIIDFGGTRLGDPAYDFAGLLSSYGENFFKLCINMYPDGNKISDRVKFYKSTFALQEALHGIENDDEQAFKNGISAYI
jgi:aminoglycoside 2''-phosphotransferase